MILLRYINDRTASFLAVLFSVMTMTTSPAKVEGLILPQTTSDGITLHLSKPEIEATEPSDLLQVFVAPPDPCCDGRVPMAGRYTRTGDVLTFSPAFGFESGHDYVVRLRTKDGDTLVPFRLASGSITPPASVTAVYPSGDVLPENVLRFYIHFSVPMRPHVAFDYIKLRDAFGRVDNAAFMRFKQELWNEDRTRLTLLMDPGRIKRNVATNVELGPALLEGRDYMLTVDAGWLSFDGSSVLPAFAKRFSVSPPLRTRPDISRWQVAAPCIGTKDTLTISFDRPFDRHLLSRDIGVVTETTAPIAGRVEVGELERSWSFTPVGPWPEEAVFLHVNPTLEDVAANNFRDLLDHQEGDEGPEVSAFTIPVNLGACK